MQHSKISLVMVVHGNPKYIIKSLTSALPLVSEIVLIDIGMDRDLRSKLKKEFSKIPLKIIEVDQVVPYVELIREESKQHAKYDYVLFLDEDEELSEDLVTILNDNIGKYDYYAFPRKNILFGKWIENSRWWPDYQVRLFRKSKVVWPKIIHSQPELTGNGYSIGQEERFALKHYNYDTIDQYLSKSIRYAKAQAEERLIESKNYTIADAFNEGIGEFMSRFFADSGYKDGLHGLVLSMLQFFYCFLVYCYYFEGKKFKLTSTNAVSDAVHLFKQGTYETNYWLGKQNLESPILRMKSKLINKLLK